VYLLDIRWNHNNGRLEIPAAETAVAPEAVLTLCSENRKFPVLFLTKHWKFIGDFMRNGTVSGQQASCSQQSAAGMEAGGRRGWGGPGSGVV
jgi:hypothetical protein